MISSNKPQQRCRVRSWSHRPEVIGHMRRLHTDGCPISELAEMYSVSETTMRRYIDCELVI